MSSACFAFLMAFGGGIFGMSNDFAGEPLLKKLYVRVYTFGIPLIAVLHGLFMAWVLPRILKRSTDGESVA